MRFSTRKGLRLEKTEVRKLASALEIVRGIAQHSSDKDIASVAGAASDATAKLLDTFDPLWKQTELPLTPEAPVDGAESPPEEKTGDVAEAPLDDKPADAEATTKKKKK